MSDPRRRPKPALEKALDMDVVETILDLFRRSGEAAYFGEPVTQSEHALQAAWQASRDGATAALILAALLHDVGHLLHRGGEDIADRGIDMRHEIIGANWLSRWYSDEVIQPIRLHVAAKRYLCRMDPSYRPRLSAASQQSLVLQGGAFSQAEAGEFEQQRHWKEAIQLRRWDEAAKVPGLTVPELAHYRSLLSTGGR
jgi:phosphonate degradation associated HDIG domain protein